MDARVTSLKEGTRLITPEEKNKILQEYDNNRKSWVQRKKLFKNTWSTVTETYQGSVKDLKEQMGIEEDERVFA
jgi:hypothetical protein